MYHGLIFKSYLTSWVSSKPQTPSSEVLRCGAPRSFGLSLELPFSPSAPHTGIPKPWSLGQICSPYPPAAFLKGPTGLSGSDGDPCWSWWPSYSRIFHLFLTLVLRKVVLIALPQSLRLLHRAGKRVTSSHWWKWGWCVCLYKFSCHFCLLCCYFILLTLPCFCFHRIPCLLTLCFSIWSTFPKYPY